MSFRLIATLFFLTATAILSCNNSPVITEIWIGGKAQGTTYSIKYHGIDVVNYQQEIDSILKRIDQSLSTYVDSSTISKINNNDSIGIPDKYFVDVFFSSLEINRISNGAFDPTVKPLVDAWGFGTEKMDSLNPVPVDSLLKLVGIENFQIHKSGDTYSISKSVPMAQLDFNGIAQGYSVDVISDFLLSKNLKNHLVEIGGEIITKGRNSEGEIWKVGIDRPVAKRNKDKLQAIVKLENKAMATSGSYRKFYVKDGKKYSHTIDPITGYTVDHNLLSATVIANHCMIADAFATAFMVLGVDRTIDFLEEPQLGIEVYLIYSDESGVLKTYISEGLKENIEEQN